MNPADPQRNVARFLAARGVSADVIHRSVGRAFGPPLLATVTGSVPLGFANESSDLDIFVIVESPDVSPLPIPFHESGLHVDVRYFSSTVTQGWEAMLELAFASRSEPLCRDRLISARFALENASRFALGYSFIESSGLETGPVGDGSLRGFARQFWLIESLRNSWMAGVAAEAGRHRFAGLRRADALLARLEAYCAGLGQYYVGAKWIGDKLSTLGEASLLDELRATLQSPLDAASADAIGSRLTHGGVPTVDDLGPTDVVLTVASDVEEFDILGRRLLTRWSTRGAWAGDEISPLKEGGVLWEGAALDRVPPQVAALVLDDFAWVSTRRAEADD